MSEDNGGKSKLTKTDLLRPLSVRKVRMKVNKFLMPASRKDAVPHYFSQKQIRFLEVYSETMDIAEACKQSGMTRYQVQKSPYLNAEIQLINQAAMFKHRNTVALGRHERLMEKFEQEFDNNQYDKDYKKSVMSTLAKMSETSLKASGAFTERKENTGILGVQVVINIGDGGKKLESAQGQVIDIEPT